MCIKTEKWLEVRELQQQAWLSKKTLDLAMFLTMMQPTIANNCEAIVTAGTDIFAEFEIADHFKITKGCTREYWQSHSMGHQPLSHAVR